MAWWPAQCGKSDVDDVVGVAYRTRTPAPVGPRVCPESIGGVIKRPDHKAGPAVVEGVGELHVWFE